MAFVQLIEFETSRMDEMRALGDQWEQAAGDDSRARRRILCQDRDHPNRYCNIVFFDSYESAMENSELPATQEFAQKMMGLSDGPARFHNLDVLDDSD